MEYLGEIPADEAVRDSILRGGLLHDLAEDSIILGEMEKIVRRITEEQ